MAEFNAQTYAQSKGYSKYFQKDGQWYANFNGRWVKAGSKEEARGLAGLTSVAPTPTPTEPTTAAMTSEQIRSRILTEIQAYKPTYAQRPEGFRENIIKGLTNEYGETYRQFIVDTIYKELRSPGEPEYIAPPGTTYAEEEKEEEMTWADIQMAITDAITAAWTQKEDIGEFEWTDVDTERIFAEFEELYGPGYKALIAKEQVGAREAVEEITRTKELAMKRQTRNLEEALTESRAYMATIGGAFSGEKEKLLREQKEVSTEEMENIRALAQRGRTETLRGLESQIGTQATQALYPGYEMPPEYAGLGLTTPASLMYGGERQPITGIPGALTRQQWLDWEMEKRTRKAEEMETWRQQFQV